MILKTFQYRLNHGWSLANLPDLDSDNTLVLIFASPAFIKHDEPIKQIAAQYPNSKIIGCSSAGEISGSLISDNSLSVAVMKFEKTIVKATHIKIKNTDESFAAGATISKNLSGVGLRSIFVLSDGLQINGSELVKGLNTLNNEQVVITGGLAGDGGDFKQTWTIFNGKIDLGAIVAIGFYGDHIKVGHGSRGGWDIFGPERLITRAKHNILYELDDKPALSIYKEYLGEKSKGLPATGLLFPLSIRKNVDDNTQLVRTILAVNEADQSLIFAGDMPCGYLAKLMRANFDRLIEGAYEASKLIVEKQFKESEAASPALLIAISCVGRRLLLGERTEEETETTLELFPSGTEQIGFYSYGELSPFTEGHCDLHNQTMTLTSICEEV